MMAVQTLKLGKRRYVVIPEEDFHRLQAKAEEMDKEDRGDVAEAGRRKAEGRSRPYGELRKKLGLA